MQEPQPTVEREAEASAEPPAERTAVPVADGVTARLPPTADAEEAAAIVAAIASHLQAEEDAASEDEEETMDRWKLAARLGSRRRGRLTPETGRSTWKLAGRTRRL